MKRSGSTALGMIWGIFSLLFSFLVLFVLFAQQEAFSFLGNYSALAMCLANSTDSLGFTAIAYLIAIGGFVLVILGIAGAGMNKHRVLGGFLLLLSSIGLFFLYYYPLLFGYNGVIGIIGMVSSIDEIIITIIAFASMLITLFGIIGALIAFIPPKAQAYYGQYGPYGQPYQVPYQQPPYQQQYRQTPYGQPYQQPVYGQPPYQQQPQQPYQQPLGQQPPQQQPQQPQQQPPQQQQPAQQPPQPAAQPEVPKPEE